MRRPPPTSALFPYTTLFRSQKREYRRNAARIQALPEPYRAVATAVQRYLTYYGGVTDGETIVRMSADFGDLWERRSEEHTSELQSRRDLVCRLLLEKKKREI